MKALVLSAALLLATLVALANGGVGWRTVTYSVGPTPVVIGEGSGRVALQVRNAGAASIWCGDPGDDPDTWFEVATLTTERFGAIAAGRSTAQAPLMCRATSTPQTVYAFEEGDLPRWTSTPTETATPEPTPT